MTSRIVQACLLALSLCSACTTEHVVITPPRRPPAGATFLTASDGTRLYTSFTGRGARGVVWYVLGSEVGSRRVYPVLTDALHAAGYATAELHPRGAGYSDGPRGDSADYEQVIEDYRKFSETLHTRYPGAPLYMLGHSAGAAVALQVAVSERLQLAGLILVNPAYKLVYSEGMGPGFSDYVAFAFNYVFRPSVPTVDMNARPQAIRDAEDRAEALTMRSDPLVVRFFSMRTMAAQGALMERCPANASRIHAPLLLVSGKRDALVDPAGTAEIFAAVASREKQRLSSPGGHGTSAVETVVPSLLGWIEAHRELGETH